MKLLKLHNRKNSTFKGINHRTELNYLEHKNNFFSECCFNEMLCLERRRTERTKKPICLMLFNVEKLFASATGVPPYAIIPVLASSIREIDICGWHKYESSIGIIFTALGEEGVEASVESILNKVRGNLLKSLPSDIVDSIGITHHIFPEEHDLEKPDSFINSKFYPEAQGNDLDLQGMIKRVMDIVGGIVGILIFSPLFIIIPLLIKLTSQGPVFFRQERIGQYGNKFIFLKFRSMYLNCDDRIHRDYIKQLMAGKSYEKGNSDKVFKITNDPRVTPLGKFLRKSSLDELPQFFNVLLGDMSLVGPRPPIPYEFRSYNPWHRYRLMKRKPGITGLWQVKGRSLTTFDGMVRMDLKYIQEWSLWADVKILLQTPLAVMRGTGAY